MGSQQLAWGSKQLGLGSQQLGLRVTTAWLGSQWLGVGRTAADIVSVAVKRAAVAGDGADAADKAWVIATGVVCRRAGQGSA